MSDNINSPTTQYHTENAINRAAGFTEHLCKLDPVSTSLARSLAAPDSRSQVQSSEKEKKKRKKAKVTTKR